MNILLVDDDPLVRNSFAKLLKREQHTVTTAGKVSEALRSFHENPFDLCITDIALPDGTGADLIRELRKDPNTAHMPIIVLSGFAAEQQHEIIALKPHAIYQKPVAIEDLRWAIEDATRHAQSPR